MRSSKSRSRNKSRSNPRSLGNVVNRVFDSSGPEGKVRGTPQQIIEKYLALARDAQLSHDRVAEQSFLQHAEHYTRMLGEAQREQAERQAQFGGQQPGVDGREEQRNGYPYQGNQPQGERRDDRGDGRNEPRDTRRDDRSDNRQPRRDDRNDRRDEREDNRRDERPTVGPVTEAPAEAAAEILPLAPAVETPAAEAPAVKAQADPVPSEDAALPELSQPDLPGLPEAQGDDNAVPVETPESRDEAAVDLQAAPPRTRKPRATTPRRAPQRRRRTEDGEAVVATPEAAGEE
ncbi:MULTISPECIES: DUF4167 domain-containing protein [unclassified Paracoccus (in: a-proteobacteria)]|uniref:DUF4167 domain-containing protein n=1 Tax=unclassified Paracoccus (in: a-proteobacteria) TaxID=2688777 RepID=UPI0015FEBC28|nr:MULTISPECIES: DUF4167 domain-containing protein [unclassified Paracoccus (in: a-proteobacteria)]MBB1490443.1 DUF4167 domain-containing protein [Paracoccus sp. MC1854]MBB1497286.1 DUF4167 domain-containing protein [Paracoccus sp. MC1862]QQO44747.1 DUF4167 domain-containing protein [Paracoccus sp. MC1862]